MLGKPLSEVYKTPWNCNLKRHIYYVQVEGLAVNSYMVALRFQFNAGTLIIMGRLIFLTPNGEDRTSLPTARIDSQGTYRAIDGSDYIFRSSFFTDSNLLKPIDLSVDDASWVAKQRREQTVRMADAYRQEDRTERGHSAATSPDHEIYTREPSTTGSHRADTSPRNIDIETDILVVRTPSAEPSNATAGASSHGSSVLPIKECFRNSPTPVRSARTPSRQEQSPSTLKSALQTAQSIEDAERRFLLAHHERDIIRGVKHDTNPKLSLASVILVARGADADLKSYSADAEPQNSSRKRRKLAGAAPPWRWGRSRAARTSYESCYTCSRYKKFMSFKYDGPQSLQKILICSFKINSFEIL